MEFKGSGYFVGYMECPSGGDHSLVSVVCICILVCVCFFNHEMEESYNVKSMTLLTYMLSHFHYTFQHGLLTIFYMNCIIY